MLDSEPERRGAHVARRFTAARLMVALPAILLVVGIESGWTAEDPADLPIVTLVRADPLELTGHADSNSPVAWDTWDGRPEVFVVTSVAGQPHRQSGPAISELGNTEQADITPWPDGGNWMEAIIPDITGKWYGFYHNETSEELCGDKSKSAPRVGMAWSADQGAMWMDLGIILEAAPDTLACDTSNEYFVGGVGDFSALLDRESHDVYIYFSEYGREKENQGIAVARLPWADLDDPVGKLTVWNDGVWLPPTLIEDDTAEPHWEYPEATSLLPPTKPWHTGDEANVFWGPSIHWNQALQRYVMLLNRTNGDAFGQEGIYVSFNWRLDNPTTWTTPYKILNGGSWYPQVIGLERGVGTDTWADRTARFFMSGRSDFLIQFTPPAGELTSRRK